MKNNDIEMLAHMLDECDCGGCDCGGCDCGCGMTTCGVLGTCDHSGNGGFMGPGCFHVPFPAAPVYYGWTAKKNRTKKVKKYKNPYISRMTTVTAESEEQSDVPQYYSGSALDEFNTVTKDQPDIFAKVLYYNRTLKLAWLVQKNGILIIYKPMVNDDETWDIVKTYLNKSGQIVFLERSGGYSSENEALTDIWKMAQNHQERLNEMLRENRFSSRDIMNWEAHGRDPRFAPSVRRSDVNVHAVKAELKQKFFNQFESVDLINLGGTWKAEFSVAGIESGTEIKGQQRVKTVIPMIDRIVQLLRLRGIETNQYNICAVSVQ